MHTDDVQSPRAGEYSNPLSEEDGAIDPDLLTLTRELGRGAFGVGVFPFFFPVFFFFFWSLCPLFSLPHV